VPGHLGRAAGFHPAPAADHDPLVLDQEPVRVVERVVVQPEREPAVLQDPDAVGQHVGDEHPAILGRGRVVQELGSKGVVAGLDGTAAAARVDGDQPVDVGGVEHAVGQRQPGRRIEARGPFQCHDLAVRGELGDEAVAVLLHHIAVGVGGADHARSRVVDHGFGVLEPGGLPDLLRLGMSGSRQQRRGEQRKGSRVLGHACLHRQPTCRAWVRSAKQDPP
jgi:hypothetical protein